MGQVIRAARLLALLLLLAASGGPAAWAQEVPLSLLEVQQISAVRQNRSAANPDGVVTAAQAYLSKYPKGRYADEALLALAEGLAAKLKSAESLQAYDRLIADYPDSAFRDQAMVQSLPLLKAAGREQDALARMEQMTAQNPQSIHRNQAGLWKAQTLYGDKKYDEAIAVLNGFQPGEDLSADDQTAYLRILALATWRSGKHREAQPQFERYLKREDSAENKAEVLMLAASQAREEQHFAQALGYYGQVVERYPAPAYLPDALFQRAELYATTAVGDTADDIGRARLKQAIAFYSESLEGKDSQYRAPALAGRARLLTLADRPEDALRDLERLAAIGGPHQNDPETIRTRVALLRKLNRGDEAAAALAAAMKNATIPPQVRLDFTVEQAALLYDRKDCVQVEALLQPMPIFSDPVQRSRAFFMRGFCRYNRGLWQQASVDLEGLVNDPAYQSLVVPPLLDSYEKSGQTVRLTQLLEELIAAGRVEATEENMQRLARGYESLGEPAKILDAYRRLAAIHPQAAETPTAQLRQGMAEEALGHNDQALAHFEAALAKPPENEAETAAYLTALERIQTYYRQAGHHAELLELNTQAAATLKSPASQVKVKALQRDALLDWGQAAQAQGKPAEAVAHLEAARALTSPKDGARHVDVVLALAAAYVQNKQPDKGLQVYRDALIKTPEGEPRAALISAGLAQHPEWSGSLAKGSDREAAIKFYERELKALPKDRANERYATSLKLDALYRAGNDYSARATLFAALEADPAFAAQQNELNAYRAEIYREWGTQEADKNQSTAAVKYYRQALALIDPADWPRRYQVTVALGQVYSKQKTFPELVLAYEDVLPQLKDEVLQSEVLRYLGQVHLEWAREAEASGNLKSARIRLWRALDYLPAADGEHRAAAALRLAAVLQKDQQAPLAATMLADAAKALPQGRPRQQVALALGVLQRDSLKNRAAAGEWLAQADAGDNHPVSLEAAYLMADLELQAKDSAAALTRLEGMLGRKADGTPWEVPIHYRVAVLYHQQGDLQKALAQYRAVAGVRSADQRERYAEAIAQSKKQVDALSEYLRLSGGEQGSKIAVPKVDAAR